MIVSSRVVTSSSDSAHAATVAVSFVGRWSHRRGAQRARAETGPYWDHRVDRGTPKAPWLLGFHEWAVLGSNQ